MKRIFEMLALVLLLALSCQRVAEEPVQPQETPAAVQAEEPQIQQVNMYLDDDLVLQVEAALEAGTLVTKSDGFDNVLEQMDVVSLERLFPDAGEFEARHRAFGLHKWYVVRYKGNMPATKAEGALAEVPGVVTVEPHREIVSRATTFFNDPYESRQWHYHNDGSNKNNWKAGVDVNVVPVWNNFTTGDPNVVVAVVDAGIDFSHVDLADNVNLANSHNFLDGSGNITAGDHGTHVAGTIAAVNNNGIGVSGIAGGDAAAGKPGTTLISCEIFGPDGKGNGSGEQAIVWAADHGAVLANNSWGYDYWDKDHKNYDATKAKSDHEFFLQPNEGQYHSSLKDAVDYFNKNAGLDKNGKQVGPMAGGVCFFSAGNEANEYGAPSEYPGIMSVGSVGPTGIIASYSCYGDWVDIAAPGGDSRYDTIYSTYPDNKYGYMQGTSMACPHATGVAALVVAACGGNGFTRDMLIEKLIKGSSQKIDLSGYKIGPMIDAWQAVNYGDTTPPDPVTTLSAKAKSNTITATWRITGHDGVPAAGFQLLYSTSKEDLEASTPADRKEGVEAESFGVSTQKVGDVAEMTLSGLSFNTGYYLRVYAYNSNLVYSNPSSTVSVQTEANNPPVITPEGQTTGLIIRASETKTIPFTITDPDGHSFTVTHTPGSSAESWRSNPDGSYTLQIEGTKATPGSYSAQIEAKDSFGASAKVTVSYSIRENHAPVLSRGFDNMILNQKGDSFTFNLSDYFTDEDGDVLTYTASSSSAALHVTANSGKLSGTAMTDGLATITVTATDPLKKSVSAEFKVAVRTSGLLVSAYPSPASDVLYISNNELQPHSMDVKILASTGGTVLETTVSGSAFEPAQVDISSLAPGVYTVVITYNGNDYKQTVVKK